MTHEGIATLDSIHQLEHVGIPCGAVDPTSDGA